MSKVDYSKIDLKSLASLIFETLKNHGIEAILVGGACVTIYSRNEYQSYDLDFVTYEETKKVEDSLASIGFKKKGRYFIHEDCPYFIDFINPPIAIGNQPIREFEELNTIYGSLKLLTPIDCVKDRLAAYYHWSDQQSLNQAILVVRTHKIDLEELKEWSRMEGMDEKFKTFEERLAENNISDCDL